MHNQKWWQDNDRYIPDPWDEITRLQKELEQMSITEAALRESLTGLSRESNEYRYKIETENAALLARIEGLRAINKYVDEQNVRILRENAALRNTLQEIATTAHCIALAGPLNTPSLQDAWSKFMKIDSMASNALAKNK